MRSEPTLTLLWDGVGDYVQGPGLPAARAWQLEISACAAATSDSTVAMPLCTCKGQHAARKHVGGRQVACGRPADSLWPTNESGSEGTRVFVSMKHQQIWRLL